MDPKRDPRIDPMIEWRLEPHRSSRGARGPVVACIMDGVGVGAHDDSDAVWLARTPSLDWLARHALYTELRAHGTAVGLPSDADMGNSEVGHNALGAGRVFDQGAKLVNAAIRNGRLFEGDVWKRLVARVKKSGQPMHFIGLLSDGNVHSHIDHLFAMLRRCSDESVEKVRVHILLDGRDVPKTSALQYVDALEAVLESRNREGGRDYRIASGGGRMCVTMDRYESDWHVVERGWNAHVHGKARAFSSAREAIETFRSEQPGVLDQNLPAFVIAEDGEPVGRICDGASVICFNFRGDRVIELCRTFEEAAFTAFDRGHWPDVAFAGMMQYDGDLLIPEHYLVSPPTIDRTLGQYLARNGQAQLAISETQKFGHVTYFWNGNRSGYIDERLESYVEIPSDTRPFEERPWMRAAEITDRLIDELRSGRFRHARTNFANGDMVGHTGDRDAAVLAVEAVDLQVGRLVRAIDALGGALLLTADHGNCDDMFERDEATGKPLLDAQGLPRSKTSHSTNPVPCYIFAPDSRLELAPESAGRGLANVAATLLQLMGYAAPEGYAPSLLAG